MLDRLFASDSMTFIRRGGNKNLMIRRLMMGVFSLMIMALLIHPVAAIADDTKDMVTRITVQELKAKMDHGGVLIIDVRSGDDYARSKIKIKGAVRISVVKLEEMSNTLPKDKEIVTYCT
jgi:hypothetical protein